MKKYEIKLLTKEFYEYYSSKEYKEILFKKNRPYLVLLIKVCDLDFAIPFRSNIKHKYCYQFSNGKNINSGLDFTKSIIIENNSFIGIEAFICDNEYIELNTYFNKIIRSFKKYIKTYIKILNKKEDLRTVNEIKIYNNSSLKYFSEYLMNINTIQI